MTEDTGYVKNNLSSNDKRFNLIAAFVLMLLPV